MNLSIEFKHRRISGRVTLPASKSISNRVLVIRALSGGGLPVENLSDSDDTNVMRRILDSGDSCFDVGHAGTAMRFLTAFFARTPGEWEITGSERMKRRPIGILVEALNRIGARISYAEEAGYPPLRICGSCLTGGELDIPASVSSQYISALVMVAPYMEKGLRLRLTGKTVSAPYIDMTLRIMREFGADAVRDGAQIRVAPVPYRPVRFRVEPDWSAASYFYELLAIAGDGEIRLPGLSADSVQGDVRQVGVWEKLGVTTRFSGDGAVLTRSRPQLACLAYDFVDMPDLVPSFAVACCLSDIPFDFSGVETLRIKETDRLKALINELAKLGYGLGTDGYGRLFWHGEKLPAAVCPEICTYHDHRMAMAFAPAAWRFPGLTIEEKEVVAKSFPRYWEEMNNLTR